MKSDNKTVKRSFMIEKKLLDKFKIITKKERKTQKRTLEEAMKLWLDYYSNK